MRIICRRLSSVSACDINQLLNIQSAFQARLHIPQFQLYMLRRICTDFDDATDSVNNHERKRHFDSYSHNFAAIDWIARPGNTGGMP